MVRIVIEEETQPWVETCVICEGELMFETPAVKVALWDEEGGELAAGPVCQVHLADLENDGALVDTKELS